MRLSFLNRQFSARPDNRPEKGSVKVEPQVRTTLTDPGTIDRTGARISIRLGIISAFAFSNRDSMTGALTSARGSAVDHGRRYASVRIFGACWFAAPFCASAPARAESRDARSEGPAPPQLRRVGKACAGPQRQSAPESPPTVPRSSVRSRGPAGSVQRGGAVVAVGADVRIRGDSLGAPVPVAMRWAGAGVYVTYARRNLTDFR